MSGSEFEKKRAPLSVLILACIRYARMNALVQRIEDDATLNYLSPFRFEQRANARKLALAA